jgi:hypothetical protein
LTGKAITNFKEEAKEKVRIGQALVVAWDSIKDNLPWELKISPIAPYPTNQNNFAQFLNCLSTYGYNSVNLVMQ